MEIKLLNIIEGAREEEVQKYLSNHKKILIAAFGKPWAINECIAKFRFGTEFISDFVLITGGSFNCRINLIELEPPTARPFTKKGTFARRLNDALGQVNDWLIWIEENDDYFRRALESKIPKEICYKTGISFDSPTRYRGLFRHIKAKIIMGRRSMMTDEDNKRRAVIFKQTEGRIEIVPYERLWEIEQSIDLGEDEWERF